MKHINEENDEKGHLNQEKMLDIHSDGQIIFKF